MKRLILSALALTALVGCGHPQTLQYDFARSYTETFSMQADLDRPSVNMELYELSGVEGIAIRAAAEVEATDAEDNENSSMKVGM